MSDSLERLYLAVIAAKDLDPRTSRTARLFQRGPAKMAKKLAEEAVEVVIDAVTGDYQAVVRESAEKLPKTAVKMAKELRKEMHKAVPPRIGRRPIVALASRNLSKRG
jgi:phosphoribosyl-ATP pyrophosphohydrolase